MTEFKIFKFRETGTTPTILETSEEMQITGVINRRSSFKTGKMNCYNELLKHHPDAHVLGLVYEENGKFDIEVGVGGLITQKESIRGVSGFDNACVRELAEETKFSINAQDLHAVQHLRVGRNHRGISYLIPASMLQQLKSVLEPSPNSSDDPQRRRIDTYIFGSEEEIEKIARDGRTHENGIVGYTVLKLSDLKPEGYSPKARKAEKEYEGVELKEIVQVIPDEKVVENINNKITDIVADIKSFKINTSPEINIVNEKIKTITPPP
jgi:ADP-ribose pyrophosphatase YjhB (NUDIX family)